MEENDSIQEIGAVRSERAQNTQAATATAPPPQAAPQPAQEQPTPPPQGDRVTQSEESKAPEKDDPHGPQVVNGVKGLYGKGGADGTKRADGKSATNGNKGAEGKSGTEGKNGPDGKPGAAGKSAPEQPKPTSQQERWKIMQDTQTKVFEVTQEVSSPRDPQMERWLKDRVPPEEIARYLEDRIHFLDQMSQFKKDGVTPEELPKKLQEALDKDIKGWQAQGLGEDEIMRMMIERMRFMEQLNKRKKGGEP